MTSSRPRKRVRWDDQDEVNASDNSTRSEQPTNHTRFTPLGIASWLEYNFEMVRVLPNPPNSGPGCLSSWMLHAMLDVPHTDPEAPSPTTSWGMGTVFTPGSTPWKDCLPVQVLDMLRFAIEARDPRMVGTVWAIMRRRAGSWEKASAMIRDNVPFAESLFKASCSKFVNTVTFLALVSRRPILLLAVLQSGLEAPGFVITAASAASLTCICLAIQDCVFGPDRSISYDKGYEAFSKRHHNIKFSTDSALYLPAWNRVTAVLLKMCGSDVAKDVCVTTWTRPHKEEKEIQPVFDMAVRYAELNPRFLEQMLAVHDWSAATLDAALKVAISPTGVRGPNLTGVIAKLYGALLYEWKSNASKRKRGVIGEYDELAYVWRNLAASATGYDSVETGRDGNMPMPVSPFLTRLGEVDTEGTVNVPADSSLRRHPEEWKGIFESMIACHAPDDADGVKDEKLEGCESCEWDTSSPLFESLIRHVIYKLINDAEKTELLVYFIGVLDKGRGEGRSPPTWLQIHGLINMLALNHPLVLGIAIQHMHCDDEGNKHPHPLTRHHEALQSGLLLCLLNKQRQSSRLLVKALVGNFCTTEYILDETHEIGTDVKLGFLPYYVVQMGEGATAETRRKHGEDYGLFINGRVEADFKDLLNAMDWPQDVLQEALKFASHYQRPICAVQLLSASYGLSPGEDPYLLALSAWLHEPGNRGAKAAASEFDSLLVKK